MNIRPRRTAAFTIVELLVAASISSVVGLIIFGVASEGVAAFARNIGINRSYTSARATLNRISGLMQTAGHVPVLVDASGADLFPVPAMNVPEPGVRFWRYDSTPEYYITTPTLTASSLVLDKTAPTANDDPSVGDMLTISILGFQAQITAVTSTSTSATVSFSGTIASNTFPTLTAGALSYATSILNAAATTTGKPNAAKMTCINWTPVAFIAVSNQLRYYPRFVSGTTAINTAANYRVLAYLTSSVGGATAPAPFSLGPSPSINVDLYAETPDYNNRTNVAGTSNNFNGLNTATTYTQIQTAISPRNPTLGLIRNP